MSTNIQICDGNNAVFLVINEQISQPKNDFVPKSRRFIEQKVNKFLKKVTSAEHEFWNDQSFCPNHADIPQTPKTLEPNEHNNVKKVKKREPKMIAHSEFWDSRKFLPPEKFLRPYISAYCSAKRQNKAPRDHVIAVEFGTIYV